MCWNIDYTWIIMVWSRHAFQLSYKNIYTYNTHCVGGIPCLLLFNQHIFLQTEQFLINMNKNKSWRVIISKLCQDWAWWVRKKNKNIRMAFITIAYSSHCTVWMCILHMSCLLVSCNKCHETSFIPNFTGQFESYDNDYLCYSSVIIVAYSVLYIAVCSLYLVAGDLLQEFCKWWQW